MACRLLWTGGEESQTFHVELPDGQILRDVLDIGATVKARIHTVSTDPPSVCSLQTCFFDSLTRHHSCSAKADTVPKHVCYALVITLRRMPAAHACLGCADI